MYKRGPRGLVSWAQNSANEVPIRMALDATVECLYLIHKQYEYHIIPSLTLKLTLLISTSQSRPYCPESQQLTSFNSYGNDFRHENRSHCNCVALLCIGIEVSTFGTTVHVAGCGTFILWHSCSSLRAMVFQWPVGCPRTNYTSRYTNDMARARTCGRLA